MLLESSDAIESHRPINVHGIDVGQAGSDARPVAEDATSDVLGGEVHGQALGTGPMHAPGLAALEPGFIRVLAAGGAGVVVGLVAEFGRGVLALARLVGRGGRRVVGVRGPLTGDLGLLALWFLYHLQRHTSRSRGHQSHCT